MTAACAIAPPDVEVCVNLPSEGAFCTFSISPEEREIPAEEWKNMQLGRFSMSPEGFSEYQKFVEKACVSIKCSDKERKALDELLFKARVLNEKIY